MNEFLNIYFLASKSGKCPVLDTEPEKCPDFPESFCLRDFDCDGNEKCCSDGCSLKCLPPTPIAGAGGMTPRKIKGEMGDIGQEGEKVT